MALPPVHRLFAALLLSAALHAQSGAGTVGSGLTYASYFGGALFDEVRAAIPAGDDVVILAGSTASVDFPTTPGAAQDSLLGYSDAFVCAVDVSSGEILWSTLLGGSDPGFLILEAATALALDPSGDVFVAGVATSSDFPTTPGVPQAASAGGVDAFVARLHPGGSLAWCTLLGGSAQDEAAALAVSPAGVVVTGCTTSKDGTGATPFPTTAGAFDTSFNSLFLTNDVFVARLSTDGASLQWSTFLGGATRDEPYGLAVDATGDVLLAGLTTSADYPTTPGVWDPVFNGLNAGESDGFVTKLASGGDMLRWSTFLGGIAADELRALVLTPSGLPTVAGLTHGTFPVTSGALQGAFGGGATDAVVTQLAADGSTLVWSTLLGGSGAEEARALAMLPTGEPVVAGFTESADFPVTPDASQPELAGARDAFVSKLAANAGSLVHSGLRGGTEDDEAKALALDDFGAAELAGGTFSALLPTSGDAAQPDYGGFGDGWLARFALPPWTNLGNGKAGTGGLFPRLTGTGTLITGSTGSLELTHAKPGALWYLFIGFAEGYVPFKGGTFVPFPAPVTVVLPTLPDGSLPLAWPAWPALPQGLTVVFQGWISDAGATKGASATNGLRGVVP